MTFFAKNWPLLGMNFRQKGKRQSCVDAGNFRSREIKGENNTKYVVLASHIFFVLF